MLFQNKSDVLENPKINPQNNLIEKYLQKQDWKVKENSNTNYSLQGLNNYIVSEAREC